MRHFKWALIVTGIGLVTAIASGLLILYFITSGGAPESVVKARSEMLAQGMAILLCIIIFPFWIMGASSFGKERREALQSGRKPSKSSANKPPTKKRRPS